MKIYTTEIWIHAVAYYVHILISCIIQLVVYGQVAKNVYMFGL